ncbi:MAG: hybrid sensor histidine kinase/response regulator [Ignavibacteriaceae bacterium]|nr:hybrid sensor histidine kinase/response regulator [Ignavibacteriaceae bacterium]
MKEPLNFSIDEAVNSFSGICFWQEEAETVNSDIQYSESIFGVTGFLASEVKELKDGWLSLVRKEDRAFYKRRLDEFDKKPDENILKLKYKIIKKDGAVISVSENITVTRDFNGKVIKRFGLILDISDFTLALEKLAKKNEELEQLNVSKDDFISILSHDLRAPFTSILGFAEILLNETSLSEKDKMEYLKYIYDSSHNQLQLINYMLDWSRLQTGRLKIESHKIHAQSLVYNCISYLTGVTVRKNITISVNIPEALYIEADERLANQAIISLLSNAVKFSNEDESVEVSANIYNNQFVEFIVKDNGVGISEANREKLFNIGKLFNTEGTKGEKGSGLGLAVTKQIVEKHGGQIWFYSVEGKGSEFHFTIPAATITLLLVIDDKEELHLLESDIKKHYQNFAVLTAENAFEALGMISAKLPSLIILEHSLPLMSGLQFVNMVRKENKNILIPFIAIIDSDSETTLKSYQEIGVRTIKQRPIFTDQLKEKIELVIY